MLSEPGLEVWLPTPGHIGDNLDQRWIQVGRDK